MKKVNFKYIIVLIIALITNLNAHSQISKAEIIATGLTCSMCSNAINKQFKALVEVDSVDTDLNTNTFIVYLKKGSAITPRILKERVEKAGFFVGSMVVTMSFDNLNIDDNLSLVKENSTLVFVNTKTKTLNGDTKVKIVDKGFVTQKEYKKLLKSLSKYPTYAVENEDDYHLKVI